MQTEVIRIKRKSFLRKYNKKNGWYTNWVSLADKNEIYALVVEGAVDIQGLIAVARNKDMKALYISWMCASPENNKQLTDSVKYFGVGGHLFAIAAPKSISFGYDGYMNGFAADQALLKNELPIYHIERVILETGELFGDGSHIIYVNGKKQDDTPLGKLMQDFWRKDPKNMHYPELAAENRRLKETEEGMKQMESVADRIFAIGREEGRKEAYAELLEKLAKTKNLPHK